MKKFPQIEIKENLEEYNYQELKFIGRELGVEEYKNLDRDSLISEINKKQTKGTVNEILKGFDSLQPVGFTGVLVDFWFYAFKKNKWVTIISTLLFFISLAFTINYLDIKEAKELEMVKNENLDLNNRITDLEAVENSLKSLIDFIENQKKAIVQTEQSLKELETQKNKLQPIVESQKDTVEAIFREQEKRNWENRWIERFIGFGLGIAASIVASIIYGLIKRIKVPRRTYTI